MANPRTVLPNVHYFSQRDNANKPASECVPTSVAMACAAVAPEEAGLPRALDDALTGEFYDDKAKWERWLAGYNKDWAHLNPMQVFPFYLEFFKQSPTFNGFRARAAQLDFDGIRAEIDKGLPVVALTSMLIHAGKSPKAAANGHAVCITGYKGNCVQVQDPWGNPHTGYQANTPRHGKDCWIDVADNGWGGKKLWCLIVEYVGAGAPAEPATAKRRKPKEAAPAEPPPEEIEEPDDAPEEEEDATEEAE